MIDPKRPQLVDTGNDSFEVVDFDGNISVKILTAPKDSNDNYRIRFFKSTQEIYDESGKTVARTTDPDMAKHIRSLLVVWEKLQKKQAGQSTA
jgi:hypothetical protein